MSATLKPYIEDIICAQSTPEGVGAISLLRVSGKGSSEIAKDFLQKKSLESHRAYYKKIFYQNKFIDEVLITFFSNGNSFTGEESFEIACHGSPLIVSHFLTILVDKGARLADPGEFSYRAYLNGKIDLTKAEGIHHSIHAQTHLAKELSLNLLEGNFKNELIEIKNLVVWAASRVEASIDFSDQDIELNHDTEVFDKLNKARRKLSKLLESYSIGVVQAKGVSVSLCGPPNAGKSTLFNLLIGDERSIVSEVKGTTRDYIKESISIHGHPIQILDTAGLRESVDEIESEGIKRSINMASKSQLILFLVSEDTYSVDDEYLRRLKELEVPLVVVVTKQDLMAWSYPNTVEKKILMSLGNVGQLKKLQDMIFTELKKYFSVEKNLFIERHRVLIAKAFEALEQTNDFTSLSGVEDVISSLLYSTIDSLDEILYIEDPEVVRNQIFKDFCLGK